MEKLKNLGITIAEKFNVIVERAKTDKKFLGALIGGAVAVVAKRLYSLRFHIQIQTLR